MTNNADTKTLSLIENLGLNPNDYERCGRSWTPKGKFIPPCGNGVVFHAETAKLFMFREKEINVFKGGDSPLAWAKLMDRPSWRSFRPRCFPPRFRMRTVKLEEVINASQSDLRNMPKWKREEIAWRRFIRSAALSCDLATVIEKAHPSTGWGMLQCLVREPGLARDMFMDIPALVVLCYYNFVFHPKANTRGSFARARSMMGWRRREILSYCGFPGECVNIFRHIPPEEASLVGLLSLRKAINKSGQVKKTLLHLPHTAKITKNVFIALSHPEFVTSSLIVELSGKKNARKILSIIKDVREMRQTIGLRERHRGFASIREVRSAHAQLVKRCNEQEIQEHYGSLVFPPPPFEDAAIDMGASVVGIKSLSSGVVLAEHAQRANNCSASYGTEVCDGQCYLYEVRAEPDVGLHTVCLRLDPKDHIWVLAEVEKENNEPTDDSVRQAVLRFLASQQRHARNEPSGFLMESAMEKEDILLMANDEFLSRDWYEETEQEMLNTDCES